MSENYLFKSDRLGFRNWSDNDLDQLHEINSDPEVMKFFPSLPSLGESTDFIRRMQLMFRQRGHCYFAVETLIANEFIGFIGLSYQDYKSPFTPCVDIGWRLNRNTWGKGYATEGAKKCLEYAFESLHLDSVRSVAPLFNKKSIRVMQKIGMHEIGNFVHSKLVNYPQLSECVCYEISEATSW